MNTIQPDQDRPTAPAPLLLTREEAATTLRLCARTVDAMIRRGELPAVRIGRQVRLSVTALQEWIARREADSQAEPKIVSIPKELVG